MASDSERTERARAGPAAEPWDHEYARVNGVDLHYVVAGPTDGPLAVLLHGFPEFWFAWREHVPALAEAGYRVVAPDLRGYNRSQKPSGIDAYRLEELVGDVAGLVDEFGRERAHLVGHDWGGVIAWQVAIDRPGVVGRLAILNAPHPSAYQRELRRSPEQLARSWYAAAFQLPWLPEAALRRNGGEPIAAMLRDTSRPGTFTDDELRRYREAFCRRGVATASINYYRALFRRNLVATVRSGGLGDERVDAPTLVLWGEEDVALSTDLLDGLDRWVPDVRIRRFPDATHWIHHEEPDAVVERLLAFLDGE